MWSPTVAAATRWKYDGSEATALTDGTAIDPQPRCEVHPDHLRAPRCAPAPLGHRRRRHRPPEGHQRYERNGGADGQQIAYASTSNGISHIAIANAEVGNARTITTGVGIDTNPAWALEGKSVAYTSRTVTSTRMRLDVTRGITTPLITTPTASTDTDPAWSPASDRLSERRKTCELPDQ